MADGPTVSQIDSRPPRTDTSISATDYYDSWADQYVLSLDGGGVKGYSSLLILNRLMKYVELEERRLDEEAKRDSIVETPSPVSGDSPQETYFRNDYRGSKGTGSQETDIDEMAEYELDQIEPRDPPSLYFDYVFGTSTGGLIAIMLGRLRMKVSDALKAYQTLAGDIFGSQQWGSLYGLGRYLYDHRKLENAIKTVVRQQMERESRPENSWRPEGEQLIAGGAFNREPTFHSEPTKCRTVCVAYTSIESQIQKPFLFRSYEHLPSNHFWTINPKTKLPTKDFSRDTKTMQAYENDLNTGPAHALPIWQVARATSAAPPYFAPMIIDGENFVDGAVGCNNPARLAYREVRLMHNGKPDCIKLLLSIGTGVPEVKPMGTSRYMMMFQLVKWALGALTETEQTHELLSELSAQDKTGWYHRFNVKEKLGAMKMDTWTQAGGPEHPGTQRKIEKITSEYLSNKSIVRELKDVAAQLVSVKRERMKTKHWPMAASDTRYRCLVSGCDNGQKVRNTRDLLLKHLEKDHPQYVDKTVESWTQQRLDDLLDAGRIEH